MSNRISLMLLMTSLIITVGCDHKEETKPQPAPTTQTFKNAQSKKEVRAPKAIDKSFQIQKTTKQADKKNLPEKQDIATVSISKDSLDKEFLLRANVTIGGISPMFTGLRSRVIAFSKQSGKLYMVQANEGHQYYSILPQKNLLAEFEILSEKDGKISFDFNKGMKKLFEAGSWGIYNKDAKAEEATQLLKYTEVGVSYISKLETKNNKLNIEQTMQVLEEGSALPVKVGYMIEAYSPDPTFEAYEVKDQKHVGFFTGATIIDEDSGEIKSLAAKFNSNKKIVFGISSNTPKEYRETIREAVLYWNYVFGKDVLEVVDAPEGAVAPSYEYNIIQWVDWSTAGFARADAQLDPRTGEILNAQVFLTSVFAIGGKQRAYRTLRRLKEKAKNKKQGSLQISGLTQKPLCNYDMDDGLVSKLEDLVNSGASDEAVLRISKDYIRNTVAHELGHTLGLRHNFAGTLAASHSQEGRDRVFDEYVKTGKISEAITTSSSVMDYINFKDEVIVAKQIRTQPLGYDKLAISTLYNGTKIKEDQKLPLFCTDDDVDTYLDCNRFDSGSSMLEYAMNASTITPTRVARSVLNSFIAKKSKNKEAKLTKYPISSLEYASYFIKDRAYAQALLEGEKILSVRSQFDEIDEYNEKEVEKAEKEWLNKELSRLGGWAKVMPSLEKDFTKKALSAFDELSQNEAYIKGSSSNGDFKLTQEDIADMRTALEKFAPKLEKSYRTIEIASLSSMTKIVDSEAGDNYAKFLKTKILDTLFAIDSIETITIIKPKKEEESETEQRMTSLLFKDPTSFITKGQDQEAQTTVFNAEKEELRIPVFRYDVNIRMMALSLIRDIPQAPKDTAMDWGTKERAELGITVNTLYKIQFLNGRDFTDYLEMPDIPRSFRRWLVKNATIASFASQ